MSSWRVVGRQDYISSYWEVGHRPIAELNSSACAISTLGPPEVNQSDVDAARAQTVRCSLGPSTANPQNVKAIGRT
ncbi:hypothetical protein MIR68_007619 [Amoeboaphelidium protococcarum]|nr:hypothetical protein MIR68_007619 [Amoeboaphelidium protococcarum]KAI3645519.1 hypothetical protein MP228_008447 [Amoeboaphelidium protococcarum]